MTFKILVDVYQGDTLIVSELFYVVHQSEGGAILLIEKFVSGQIPPGLLVKVSSCSLVPSGTVIAGLTAEYGENKEQPLITLVGGGSEGIN